MNVIMMKAMFFRGQNGVNVRCAGVINSTPVRLASSFRSVFSGRAEGVNPICLSPCPLLPF